jgi:hypothetical protein
MGCKVNMLSKITDIFRKNYGELHYQVNNLQFIDFLKNKDIKISEKDEESFLCNEKTVGQIRFIYGKMWNYYSKTQFYIGDSIFNPCEVVFVQNTPDSISANLVTKNLKIELFNFPFESYYKSVQKDSEPLPVFGNNKKYLDDFNQMKYSIEKETKFKFNENSDWLSFDGAIHIMYIPILTY